MIPHWKLRTLPKTTRLRKIARILHAAEIELEGGRPIDRAYLEVCAALIDQEPGVGSLARRYARGLVAALAVEPAEELRRAVNRLRHGLLEALGEQPGEWDLLAPDHGELDAGGRKTCPVEVYLEEIRSPFNVGSIFRSAEAFGVRRLLLSPGTASPLHPRAQRSARGAVSVVPWRYAPLSYLRGRTGVVALELGGVALDRFEFPAQGALLVGSEELGLSPEALSLAIGGRVSIPMAGAKRSLNVAVAFGIVMRAWSGPLLPADPP